MGWCECCGAYLEKGVRLDLLYSQAVALLATEFSDEVLRFSAHDNIIRELHRVLPIDNFPGIIEKLWGKGRWVSVRIRGRIMISYQYVSL